MVYVLSSKERKTPPDIFRNLRIYSKNFKRGRHGTFHQSIVRLQEFFNHSNTNVEKLLSVKAIIAWVNSTCRQRFHTVMTLLCSKAALIYIASEFKNVFNHPPLLKTKVPFHSQVVNAVVLSAFRAPELLLFAYYSQILPGLWITK